MKNSRILAPCLLGALFGFCAVARAQEIPNQWTFDVTNITVDGHYYDLDSGSKVARWHSYDSRDNYDANGVMTVPATIEYNGETYTVKGVKGYEYYYYYYSEAKQVILPNTIEYIGKDAFANYPKMETMDIPASVAEIGSNAFANANGHRPLTLALHTAPPIVYGAFTSQNSNAPLRTKYIKVLVPASQFKDYTIAEYWEDCVIIDPTYTASSVVIDRVENGTLGYAVVADDLPTVRTYKDVNKLVIQSGSLNESDWYAISQMKNLIELDVRGMEFESVPNNAVEYCWQLEKVLLTDSITKIGSSAFRSTGIGAHSSYTALGETPDANEFKLPKKLKTIGNSAFDNCDSLRNIVITSEVETVPSSCFYGCDSLHRADFLNKPAAIEYYAFSNCDLYSVNIPGSAKSIDSYAFYANYHLTELIFNEGTESVGYHSFADCDSLKTFTTPASLRTIGEYCFCSIDALESCVLTEGLEEIHRYAFGNDKRLKNITFPSTLRLLLESPLGDCDGLEYIQCNSILPPTVRGNCPFYSNYTDVRDIDLLVPEWSIQEYMTTPGWVAFQNTTQVSGVMPENLYINKEFMFMFKHQDAAYRPNVRLFQNDQRIDDGFGHTKYERGNLTVAGVSHLSVNRLDMIISGKAKWYSDYDKYYGYDYESYHTEYTSNSLLVHGSMTIDDANLELQLERNCWQALNLEGVDFATLIPEDPNTQFVVKRYNSEKRAAGLLDEAWETVTEGEIGKCFIKCYNSDSQYSSKPIKFTCKIDGAKVAKNTSEVASLAQISAADKANASWYHQGNPYACFYDTRYMNMYTEEPQGKTQYTKFLVWNSYNGKYDAYDIVKDKYVLQPLEAIFVQGANELTPLDLHVEYDMDGRQTHINPRDLDYRSAPARPDFSEYTINLRASNAQGEDADRTRVVMRDDATMEYENGTDIAKMKPGTDDCLLIWTVQGRTQYAINERPMGDGTVTLGMQVGAAGRYQIALSEGTTQGLDITIEDRATGKSQLISDGSAFSFNAEHGQYPDRFIIHIVGSQTAIEGIEAETVEQPAVNLFGQRVLGNANGIVIKNGKKVLNY